jgi:anti-anti-sigma factor
MSFVQGSTPNITVEGRASGSSYFMVRGELDLSTVGRFEDAFDGVLTDGDMVLDVSGLTFVDVAGLHALSRLGRALGTRGMHLVLREPCPGLRRLISVVGEDRFPDLHVLPREGGYGATYLDHGLRPRRDVAS